jgi:AraC-like DNA-binding protein
VAIVGPRRRYREAGPPTEARDAVAAVWSMAVEGDAPDRHRVFPDGCVDLVLAPGAPPEVVGPMTAWVDVPLRPGPVPAWGLRLRPGVAQRVLGVQVSELADRTAPLEEFFGAGPATAAEGPEWVEQTLAEVVRRERRGRDHVVAETVRRLSRPDAPALGRLAGELWISERQLRRRFHAAVGLPPRAFVRVTRLQRALAAATRAGPVRWASLAHAAGYADQAHLTREVRALTGRSPTELGI